MKQFLRAAATVAAACFFLFVGCDSDDTLVASGDATKTDVHSDASASDSSEQVVNCDNLFQEWKIGDPCNSGDLCVVNATCRKGGACLGTPLACFDGNECTVDTCDPTTSCVFTPRSVGTQCNDGNACTESDKCLSSGVCLGNIVATCDDGNECTADSCNEQTGCKFTFKPGAPCEDGTKCTAPDLCIGGLCQAGTPLTCDDGNTCTFDKCDPVTGTCTSIPLAESAACSDNDACTVGDACKDGQCTPGITKYCNDNDACTTDSCNKVGGVCVNAFTNNPSTSCTDNDACTDNDKCDFALKKCQGISKPCVDQNPCTNDTCDPANGCINKSAEGSQCSDGNACTQDDKCKQSSCVAGTIKACNDNNLCTLDSCNQDTGACLNTPVYGIQCNDGDKCTLDDVCTSAGVCKGTVAACSDGNSCTSDSCNPSSGCIYEQVSGLPCDDGNPCTTKDTCKGGVCSPQFDTCDDGNDCTKDSCNLQNGVCTNTLLDPKIKYACSDGNPCTIDGVCLASGECELKGPKCDDGNPCTEDSCAATTGACYYSPIPNCK